MNLPDGGDLLESRWFGPGVKSIDHFREQLRIEGVEPRSGGANADNGSQGTWTAWH